MDTYQIPYVRIALFLAVTIPSVLSQCNTPVHLYAHHGTSETITSPNYPFNYPSSSDCQWLIQAESSSSTVGVVFSFINTESFFDKIRIYDSNTPGANLLTTIFGSTTNRYYESTGEYLYIRFTSDNAVEKSGFSLQYFSLFSTVIGQRQGLPCYALSNRHTITLTVTLSIQQTLSTFPDTYSGNDYCYWLVDTGAGNFLNISILVTDDEYGTNPGGLTVYDGNSASATALGTVSDKSQTESGSVVLGTSQQYAFFVYHRQSISQYRGFLLSFNKVGSPPAQVAPPPTISPSVVNNTCGNELLSSDNITNYVTSPNYPLDYNSHSSCVWTIRSTNESMVIQLTFEAIDMESCCDFLYVYDGETADYTLLSAITGNYYNSSGLPVYRSTGSALRLHFVSDERTQQTGFKVGFLSIPPETPSCVDQATTTILNASYSVQTFESHPEFSTSQNYNNSYEISWLIVKPKESDILSLQFTVFNLEYSMNCVFDNVTIYRGACSSDPLAKTMCGSLEDSFTYSTGKFLFVRFKTDISVTDRGFSISYVLLNSTSTDDTSSSGLPDYVRYTIAGVFTAIFVIGTLCLCVCCCRKLCPKTASLKSVAKSDMKRNLILTNTNKPKTIKVPRKKMKRSKYGNKVTIDDPKFPLAGPGITPVAPPFPLDLKDKVVGEKSTDTPKTLPPIKEKKVRKPKKDKAERIQSDGLSEDSSATILDHDSPIDFATIPPPFEYKAPFG